MATKKTEAPKLNLKAMLAGGAAMAPAVKTEDGSRIPAVRIGYDAKDNTVSVAFNGFTKYKAVNKETAEILQELYELSNGKGFRIGERAERTIKSGAGAGTLHTFEMIPPEEVFMSLGLPEDIAKGIAERCQYGWFNGSEIISRQDRLVIFNWSEEKEVTLDQAMAAPIPERYGSKKPAVSTPGR